MIHEAELTRAIAQAEQARNKKASIVSKLVRSINDAESMIAQIGEQDQNETKRLIDALKENADLKIQVAAVKKELMDQTSRANRLEAELQVQVQKYPEAMQRKGDERSVPMSTVLSFSTTRSTVEQIQTLVDLLYFALDNRTPEEEKAIKQMLADFRKELRPQINAKDSTQNFYMK